MKEHIQSRKLIPRMVNFKNMSKRCGHKPTIKGCLNTKPRGVARGERELQTIDVSQKTSRHVQGIIHNGAAKNHTDVLGTRYHKSMIGMGRW